MAKEKLIKSKERVTKYGEVFTPERLVNDMLDMLEHEQSGAVFDSLERTFLEPSCGNGNFVIEIVRRKLKLCRTTHDAEQACANVYGVDILQDNVDECRARVANLVRESYPDADIGWILERNIICGNFLKPETCWFIADDAVPTSELLKQKRSTNE